MFEFMGVKSLNNDTMGKDFLQETVIYDCACNAFGNMLSISCLGFPDPIYDQLKKSGFNTIGDILDCPFEDFYKIQPFSINTLREIIEKMHEIGYSEFGTADLKDEKTSIAYLGFRVTDYLRLKKKGFNTLSDLLNHSFRYFCLKFLDYSRGDSSFDLFELDCLIERIHEIVKRMHEIGYPEFGRYRI